MGLLIAVAQMGVSNVAVQVLIEILFTENLFSEKFFLQRICSQSNCFYISEKLFLKGVLFKEIYDANA